MLASIGELRMQLNEFECLIILTNSDHNSTSSDINFLVTCHLYPSLFLRFKRALSSIIRLCHLFCDVNIDTPVATHIFQVFHIICIIIQQ
ncbi:Fibroin light chain [Gossypium arboreum]|uniref:Fibroin light chain n=1 Tax=Gossypium arboreum TaxID=29729 RepID=A0A0B0PUH3_GOSAR|nr:Fibroin light chain [Gossypium arboreum]